ncbi:MAG: NADH-quinone oxidoreductase subunit H [Desulfamplus sp.]|nr:NADH-quinone oxidoreductase subunit H [Desulfamplus sp.]
MIESILLWIFGITIAPFFSAVILKIKAFFGGKKGPPIFINYYTLIKLFQKGSVYSKSTTFIFKLGPIISLSSAVTALMFLPILGYRPIFSFEGDVIFVLYLFGLGRFFTIAAAMDTASPFEGMGAAREAFFPIICEATMFMIFILFYKLNSHLSLADYFSGSSSSHLWDMTGTSMVFIIISLFIVLLTENSRVPVDDPATHLELTMIHEVMVLDHSGPDFAFIELGAFIKLFFYSNMVSSLILPFQREGIISPHSLILGLSSIMVVYVCVGVMESVVARYKMSKVPKFILTSFALAFFATVITMEFIK